MKHNASNKKRNPTLPTLPKNLPPHIKVTQREGTTLAASKKGGKEEPSHRIKTEMREFPPQNCHVGSLTRGGWSLFITSTGRKMARRENPPCHVEKKMNPFPVASKAK